MCLSYSSYAQINNKIIVCGNDEINIIDLDSSKDTIPHIIWTWKASNAEDLPKEYRENYFNHIDECKPIREAEEILITSSDGGVAIIDKKTKEVLFYTYVANAHSAALLPDNRIIVAGSTHKYGNRLVIFDTQKNDKILFEDSLYSAHGVVWDKVTKKVFALGYNELRAYNLIKWDTDYPILQLDQTWLIKGVGGHDLVQHPLRQNLMIYSEHDNVWSFDQNQETFEPYKLLEGIKNLKSLSINKNRQLIFIKAEKDWWSTRIYIENIKKYLSFTDRQLYKARWME